MSKLRHIKGDGPNKSPLLENGIRNYLIDIDGTVGEDIPNEEPWRMEDAEVYAEALQKCNQWYDEGHIIYFFTSRTESLREVTEKWLNKHGFKYHGIIFGKPRGGNYYWIDNHEIRAVKYEGKFCDISPEEGLAYVFKKD